MKGLKRLTFAIIVTMALLASAITAQAQSWGRITGAFSATTGEAVSLGDAVCFSGTTIFKADADGGATKTPAVGFVERAVGAATITGVVIRGTLNGQVGLTAGGPAYLSDTAGAVTQTPVAAYPQVLGFASSATTYEIDIDPFSPAGGAITGTTGTFSEGISATTGTFSGDITAAGGRVAVYCYENNDIISSQAAVAMKTNAGGTVTGIPMPYAGSILGVSALCNSAVTSGSMTFDPTVGGSVTGLQAILNTTDTTQDFSVQAKDTDAFSAGNLLGVKHTTPANLAPNTADCRVCVTIEY